MVVLRFDTFGHAGLPKGIVPLCSGFGQNLLDAPTTRFCGDFIGWPWLCLVCLFPWRVLKEFLVRWLICCGCSASAASGSRDAFGAITSGAEQEEDRLAFLDSRPSMEDEDGLPTGRMAESRDPG